MPDIYDAIPIVVPREAVLALLRHGNRPLEEALSVNPRWNNPAEVGTPVSLSYFFSDMPPEYETTEHGYVASSAQAWTNAQKFTIEEVLGSYALVADISFTEATSQNDAT